MSYARRHWPWVLVLAGTAVRLVFAFTTSGQPYDIQSFVLVRRALENAPLHAYALLDLPGQGFRHPYPAGGFAAFELASLASKVTGLAYTSLLRVPSILADAGIALIAGAVLRRRGESVLRQVFAVALIALGPSFIVISGYHGQIDNLAVLPAVAALALWDDSAGLRRAACIGLLIGIAASIKPPPAFVLLAILPSCRSWRQAATLVSAAAAVPLVVTAPFFVTTPHAVVEALRYHGYPGTSGLAHVLQPDLADRVFRRVDLNHMNTFLFNHNQLIVIGALLVVTALSLRLRALERATLLWLAFYIVTPVFFFQYLVWGLPFFILAGFLRLGAAVQLLAIVPTIIFYSAPFKSDAAAIPYAITMIGLWVLYVASLAFLAWRLPVAWPWKAWPQRFARADAEPLPP